MIHDDHPDDDPNNWRDCPACGGTGYSDEDGRDCGRCEGNGGIAARGPLPEVSESDWATFDLERGREGKGDRLARRDDQQAAALDLQWLDVIRGKGL